MNEPEFQASLNLACQLAKQKAGGRWGARATPTGGALATSDRGNRDDVFDCCALRRDRNVRMCRQLVVALRCCALRSCACRGRCGREPERHGSRARAQGARPDGTGRQRKRGPCDPAPPCAPHRPSPARGCGLQRDHVGVLGVADARHQRRGRSGERRRCRELVGEPDVPAAMVTAFREHEGHLGDRLLAAMCGALDAGGEVGPVHSAGMMLVREVPWPVADLRVDWTEDCPIRALGEVWSVYAPQLNDYVTRALDPTKAPSYGVPGDE